MDFLGTEGVINMINVEIQKKNMINAKINSERK